MEESDSTGADPMGDGADDRPSSSVVGSTVADLSSDLGAEMEVNTTAAAHAADWTLPASDANRIIGGQVGKWALVCGGACGCSHAVDLCGDTCGYRHAAGFVPASSYPCPELRWQTGEERSLQAM